MSQIFRRKRKIPGIFRWFLSIQKRRRRKPLCGDVTFIVTIPEGFTRKLLRGEKPQLLIQGMPSIRSPRECAQRPCAGGEVDVSARFAGRHACGAKEDDFELIIHRMFNPEGITQFNTIPGIMGSILSTTLILMTALSITRERENGALENLLVSVVRAWGHYWENNAFCYHWSVSGDVNPDCRRFVVRYPLHGSIFLLFFVLLIYVFLCLSIGIGISGLAQNQLQALQMSSFTLSFHYAVRLY